MSTREDRAKELLNAEIERRLKWCKYHVGLSFNMVCKAGIDRRQFGADIPCHKNERVKCPLAEYPSLEEIRREILYRGEG